MDAGVRDRVRGCAVGAAVGDALGMPLEFGPRRSEERLVREMHSGRLPVGTFTDGTETALALADSLLTRRISRSALLAGTVRVLRTLAYVRERCCGASAQGSPGRRSGRCAGSARRLGWQRLGDGLLARRAGVSRRRGQAPARELPTGPGDPSTPQVRGGVSFPQPGDRAADRGNVPRGGERLCTGPRRRAARGMGFHRAGTTSLTPGAGQQRLGAGHGRECDLGLCSTGSFEGAVVQVVSLGNDADTAGTVGGALAGAAYGLLAIPAPWRARLRGEWALGSGARWDEGRLAALADRLAQVN